MSEPGRTTDDGMILQNSPEAQFRFLPSEEEKVRTPPSNLFQSGIVINFQDPRCRIPVGGSAAAATSEFGLMIFKGFEHLNSHCMKLGLRRIARLAQKKSQETPFSRQKPRQI